MVLGEGVFVSNDRRPAGRPDAGNLRAAWLMEPSAKEVSCP